MSINKEFKTMELKRICSGEYQYKDFTIERIQKGKWVLSEHGFARIDTHKTIWEAKQEIAITLKDRRSTT